MSSLALLREDPLSRRLRTLSDQSCSDEVVGVYITTNERGLEKARSILRQKPLQPQSCHIGFSGWYNLDIISLRKSTYGILCDFSPAQKSFLEQTFNVVKQSFTRQIFVEKMLAYLNSPAGSRITFSPNFNRGPIICSDQREEIKSELTQDGSWLSSDEGFKYIRNLVLKDKISVLSMDVRDTKRFKLISKLFQDNGIVVDTLYLSNICDYMFKPLDKARYSDTVHALIEQNTLIIHCPAPTDIYVMFTEKTLCQRVDLGK